MPGRSPIEAVEAFLAPLRDAMACLGGAHFQLSPGARGRVGDTNSWALNRGEPLALSATYGFTASMHFETLDRGQSMGSERFRVTTRGYQYAVTMKDGRNELIAAHWHPAGASDYVTPHWHAGSAALSEHGVFLKRAHIPSSRISFEEMIRWILENLPDVEPAHDDWRHRLAKTEAVFREHATWHGTSPPADDFQDE